MEKRAASNAYSSPFLTARVRKTVATESAASSSLPRTGSE
jgi:hypothetical protein